jgi:hypothetical protein
MSNLAAPMAILDGPVAFSAASLRGPWFCAPGRDRLFGEPHRQAATLAQGSIIFRPVRYPILLLRNVVTAIGVGLEWHGGHLRGVADGGLAPPIWGTAQADLPPVEAWRESHLDQRPAKSRSPNGEWRYPAQDAQPS